MLGACFEDRHVRPDLGQQILRAMRPQARDGEQQQAPGFSAARDLLGAGEEQVEQQSHSQLDG
jgi:hypothetical protein